MTISSPCNRSGGKWREHPYLDDHHLRLRRLSLMFEEGASSATVSNLSETPPGEKGPEEEAVTTGGTLSPLLCACV